MFVVVFLLNHSWIHIKKNLELHIHTSPTAKNEKRLLKLKGTVSRDFYFHKYRIVKKIKHRVRKCKLNFKHFCKLYGNHFEKILKQLKM